MPLLGDGEVAFDSQVDLSSYYSNLIILAVCIDGVLEYFEFSFINFLKFLHSLERSHLLQEDLPFYIAFQDFPHIRN